MYEYSVISIGCLTLIIVIETVSIILLFASTFGRFVFVSISPNSASICNIICSGLTACKLDAQSVLLCARNSSFEVKALSRLPGFCVLMGLLYRLALKHVPGRLRLFVCFGAAGANRMRYRASICLQACT
ncbi:unnamed protein product [Protopolystoma xenopodis]|uniref:Uncharacterized protein n=1 Tax=Protopolystoma xenopodis TaxID=117903 RepID=A0A3S5C3L1_9PLAT|nr:unnamed protein product [Protopolystoma xenopodis]